VLLLLWLGCYYSVVVVDVIVVVNVVVVVTVLLWCCCCCFGVGVDVVAVFLDLFSKIQMVKYLIFIEHFIFKFRICALPMEHRTLCELLL